ncbi:amidase family protein [Variovorax terrae]|uniref:Amidase family protein n=1 Tax=Variovorax terrae TaxID=2923278 RepID=A0A9X1VZF5_9BURK|nr:amidase family protein [Variovorax terrae]MCJ0766165.1 amidase family protein [Variovorax terrae]
MHRQPYSELRAAYRAGSLSPVGVAVSALAHAEQVQERLNAFALIDHERALSLASASERRWMSGSPLSPLDGMPITVKEFAAVKGWATRRGSLVTSADPVALSAVFVERLLSSGAVLLGKTRAPEFNWKGVTDSPGYGITRNPLNPNLTPGGSSGGCSAAVGAGVVRVSLGSDAGGSVRIPAAFTGTVALKPTFGRIPLTPPPSAFFSVVHTGPIGASVADLADVMQVVSGPHAGDWSSIGLREVAFNAIPRAAGLRIGLLSEARWEGSDPVVLQGMEEVAALIAAAGFSLKTVDFNVQRASQVGAFFYSLGCCAAVQAVPDALRSQLDQALLRFVDPLKDACVDDVLKMQQARDVLAGELHGLFNHIDVLMLPTLPILPFEAGRNSPREWHSDDWMTWNPFTPAFNLTQAPAVSYPIWPQGAALPMGVQLVGARGNDEIVLAMTAWLEQLRPITLGSRS